MNTGFFRTSCGARASAPRRRVAEIQASIAARCGVTLEELLGRSKRAPIARARQVAMFVCRRALGHSYPHLARLFRRDDHTTVMHACARIEELCAVDPQIAALVAVELEGAQQ